MWAETQWHWKLEFLWHLSNLYNSPANEPKVRYILLTDCSKFHFCISQSPWVNDQLSKIYCLYRHNNKTINFSLQFAWVLHLSNLHVFGSVTVFLSSISCSFFTSYTMFKVLKFFSNQLLICYCILFCFFLLYSNK